MEEILRRLASGFRHQLVDLFRLDLLPILPLLVLVDQDEVRLRAALRLSLSLHPFASPVLRQPGRPVPAQLKPHPLAGGEGRVDFPKDPHVSQRLVELEDIVAELIRRARDLLLEQLERSRAFVRVERAQLEVDQRRIQKARLLNRPEVCDQLRVRQLPFAVLLPQ